MSLFMISSNGFDHSCFKNSFLDAGYKISVDRSCLDYSITAFHKLKIENNVNFYLTVGGDFVLAVGTCVYRNLNGAPALSLLYHDFQENIEIIRKDTVGNYAVVIKKGGRIFCWGEAFAAYDIFYYCHGTDWIISNDLSSIMKTVHVEVDENALLEQVYLFGIIGEETLFRNVFRLSGDKFISVDNGVFSLNRIGGVCLYSCVSYEDSVHKIALSMKNSAHAISENFKSVAICMTGGLDSRMSLAAFLSVGCKPHLKYGRGNSSITNTKDEDFIIDENFSSAFSIPLELWDWSTPANIDDYWNEYFKRYGFLYECYGSSNNVMESLEYCDADYITFGYMGELYRNLEWTESTESLTLNDFVESYYLSQANSIFYISHFTNEVAFKKHLTEKFRIILRKNGLDENHLKREDVLLLMYNYRMVADSKMLNLCNRMRYSSLILSESENIMHINVSVDQMRNAKFMLDIMKDVFPDVLKVPFFSHCRRMKYDKRHGTLSLYNVPKIEVAVIKAIPRPVKRFLKTILRRPLLNGENKLVNELQPLSLLDFLQHRYFEGKDLSFIKERWQISPLICHAMYNNVVYCHNEAYKNE